MGAFMFRPHIAERPEPPPIEFHVEYLNRRVFLEHVRVGAAACRIFCPGELAALPSTSVEVEVGFVGEPERFRIQGQVVSRRESIHPALREGLLVEVREPHLAAFSRLLAHANRRPFDWGRRALARVDVDFPAAFEIHGQVQSGVLRDLSHGGAFVAATGPRPSVGSLIRLRVSWGWFRRVEITGRVVWSGFRGDQAGFGVEFSEATLRGQEWIREVLGSNHPHSLRAGATHIS